MFGDAQQALTHLGEVGARPQRSMPRHYDVALDLGGAPGGVGPRQREAVARVRDVLVEGEVAREQHALRRQVDGDVAPRVRPAEEAQLDGPLAEVERERVAERQVGRGLRQVAPLLVDRRVEVPQELAVRVPLGREVVAAGVVGDDGRLRHERVAEEVVTVPVRVHDVAHRLVGHATRLGQQAAPRAPGS